MNLIAINIETIQLGQPLPFALRAANGDLLAKKSYVIRSRGELDSLVERGVELCIDTAESGDSYRQYLSQLQGMLLSNKPLGDIAAVKLAVAIMAVGTLAFLLIPETLLGLFEAEGASDLTAMGVVALRIISSHFILAAIGITLSTVFQAIGKGFYSLLMSLCRQLIVLLPAAWILSQLGGVNAVWWCFPVAEAVSLALCLALFRKVDVRMLKPLGQEA